MCFTIKVVDEKSRSIRLGKKVAEKLNLVNVRNTNLRFGLKVADIKLIIDDEIEDEMYFSQSIVNKLNLPTDCTYNIAIKNNEIVVGPFIGIYMGRKEFTLIKKLRIIHSYIANYQDLNGVLFAFTLDNVNKENLTIGGFFYNPKKDVWEKATLPYPASIFRKNTYNIEWKEHFGSLYGEKIFNYQSINKWEMYERLKQFPEVINYLPHTSLYQTMDNVIGMLNQHQNIYVKPIEGKKGKGIYNITLENNVITVKTREKNDNVEWTFTDMNQFSTFLTEKLSDKKYIIQKTIELQIDDKVVDFRIGMDKDYLGNWKNLMFVSRVSGNNSIVSNRDISGGETKLIPDVLRDIYRLNESDIENHTKQLVTVAYAISNKLEETGLNLGKLAFDFAIDKFNNPWLIEVNSKYPDDSLMDEIDNKKTYFKIRHTNMLYAKFLAGFDKNNSYHKLKIENGEDSNLIKKYNIYVAVPIEQVEEYKANVLKLIKKTKFNGNVNYHEKLKKIVLEVEAQDAQVFFFLEQIKKHIEINAVFGVEEITH